MKLSKLINKQNFTSLSFFILSTFFIALGGVFLSSCGGGKHSVKQMRQAKAAYIPNPSEKAMIQRLFLESKKPNISLPQNFAGSGARGAITVEQAVYKNPDNHTELFEENTLDPNKTYGLSEVIVEARSRFTPERDGKIDVDFVVKVPKELLDQNWMIKLQPFVIHPDSLQLLDHLVVKGQQFALKQQLDYQAYDDYLKSIVPRELYDSVFLDHSLIEQDIRERQQFYYQQYHRDWALHKEYEIWMEQQKKKDAEDRARLRGEIAEMRYDYMRRLLTHAVRDIARGVDTTGLAASYNMEFLKKSAGVQKRLSRMDAGEIEIPKKYQEVHAMQIGSKDIENLSMTSQDTLDIAKNRYKFDAIVENEMKEARKEIVKAEMIPFPYDEAARVDTAVDTGKDFLFYFKQQLPVSPGLKSVNIAMEAQVTALDESRFNTRRSDTLSYFISSIIQLVDTTLLHKETVKNRNATHRQTAYFQYRPNTWRFDPAYKNNAAELAKITKDYATFEESKSFAVDSILMQMATSLDGEFNKNADLSMKRVDDIKKYLLKNVMRGRNDSFLSTNYIGEDWQGMVRYLRARNDIQNKDAIIEILGNASNPDRAKEDIKQFESDYQIIKDSIYPKLDRLDLLFYVHRTDMNSDQEVITVDPEYIKGVRLLQNRQYDEAMAILANYPDYNAAVCLAALGYNGKAYDVLSKLKPNGNTEYLSAITAWRMQQDESAINHLLKAIELDPSKLYRLELDPDIVDMIEAHNLQERINQINR